MTARVELTARLTALGLCLYGLGVVAPRRIAAALVELCEGES